MTTRIVPIAGKTAEIIETVMSSPDVPQDETLRFKIRLSVEEIAENIVNYAYNNGNGFVEITTTLDEAGMLTISFKDAGVPFNPLEKEDPDITLSLDERPVGGLGIFICKKMMDSVSYVFEDGCNNFTMKINTRK
ncbi:MAG: ATP-binding protein [Bacteroidales bacterium]|jgi:anti-sigma regulatory factor (Ser/Thr protein kinase)|nr:ATP-binding protein [Bacteroidales bacterium]MEE3475949.1 ATP-binding protein [Candidatus Cryptobacteroides sp.]MBQ2197222.1 ATP-binding protein [Bacteroidales bacterium]MBQ5411705.1 ATP-binding protein [Bacteroidales bacterium]MBR5397849.1 ATP-binding protein [Bacteroidales bacterium]